jgi:hypothetical protein
MDTKLTQPDRSKIHMHHQLEVKFWTHALGVSKQELQKAVDKVGNAAATVRKELALIEAKAKPSECAREARKQAALLGPGKICDALLEKVRQYETDTT